MSQIDNMQRQLAAADEGQESTRLYNTRYSVLCAEIIVTINKRKMHAPEYDHISKIMFSSLHYLLDMNDLLDMC